MRIFVWSALVFCFLLLASPSQAGDIFVRALLPNPPGSDTQEWILLERSPGATFSAELTIQDGAGAKQSYAFVPVFTAGDYVRLMKAETGISLNNDTDWIEIWQEGDLLDRTEPFANLADGIVWTLLGDTWKAITSEEFATRLASLNWVEADASDDNTQTATGSATANSSPSLTTPSPIVSPRASVSPPTSSETVSPRPTSSPLPYQEWLKMPQLTGAANPDRASPSGQLTPPAPPPYPQLDGEGERQRFYDWQRRALVGAFGFLAAGVCFVVLATPPLCRWYNDKQCIW